MGLGRLERLLAVPDSPRVRWALAIAAVAGTVLIVIVIREAVRPPPPAVPLADIRGGEMAVPRVFPASLPDGIAEAADPAERKSLFLKTLLPLVLRANEAITADRARLDKVAALVKADKALSRKDRNWLAALAERYDTTPDDLATLRLRVDTVPPSLALAQAAVESGWGTSRFARDGNALFGVWTWNEDKGLVPDARAKGKTHAVKRYQTLLASVRDYMHNLNTHPAYRPLRKARAAMRARGDPQDGLRLVPSLSIYAETRENYVGLIRRVMSANNLWEFDRSVLASAGQ